jgi:predicted nucleic acid-binding protein
VIVVDASAVLEVLLRTPGAQAVEARILHPAESLHAPHLIDLEVAQVFRRYVQRGEVSPARAERSLELFAQFPIARHSHEPLLARIWRLRHNLTAYDAAYVALAEGLGAVLVTRDERIAKAKGHEAAVDLL